MVRIAGAFYFSLSSLSIILVNLFYFLFLFSILFYSILFYSILFYSILCFTKCYDQTMNVHGCDETKEMKLSRDSLYAPNITSSSLLWIF